MYFGGKNKEGVFGVTRRGRSIWCLGKEGADCALDKATADGAFPQRWGTFFADHQVTTGNEDDVHLLVHADLTGPLLLETTKLLLHREV